MLESLSRKGGVAGVLLFKIVGEPWKGGTTFRVAYKRNWKLPEMLIAGLRIVEGWKELNSVNPSHIESMSILKDAALC